MPKKKKTSGASGADGLEALKQFDIVKYRKFMQRKSIFLYNSFIKLSYEDQMLSMCTTIIRRTDMIGSPAYNKAIKWIHEHKKDDGRIF